MVLDPTYYVFLSYAIPIVLLDCWFAFYIQKNYIGFLIVSILLIPFSIPHLLASGIGVIAGVSISLAPQGLTSRLFILVFLLPNIILGVGSLVLGVWGIIYRAKAMPQPQAAAW